MKRIGYFIYYIKHSLFLNKKYKTKWVNEIPEKLQEDILYIVGNKKYPFQVVSKCPAKLCKKPVQINVSNDIDSKNRWDLNQHKDGAISLSPSIWLTRGCRCHYWIKKGNIKWCNKLNYKEWLKAIYT